MISKSGTAIDTTVGGVCSSVLFIGNITQDTVITYHPERKESKSFGGSVTFGCLAMQTYLSNVDSCQLHPSDSSSIQPQVLSKVSKNDAKLLYNYFQKKCFNKKEEKNLLKTSGIQPDSSFTKKLFGLNMFERLLIEDDNRESWLTQYELTYPYVENQTVATNNRTLVCRHRGSNFNENINYWLEILVSICEKNTTEAIFFVPVAAELDHLFVEKAIQLLKENQCKIPLICTDIQGYLRRVVDKTGEVSVNDFDYMQHVLKVLGKYVTLIKLDLEEAKKCLFLPDSEERKNATPEQCASILHQLYHFPIVAVTMGGGGSVISCREGEIHVGKNEYEHHHTTSSANKIGYCSKYFKAYTPKQVQDETGAGDTFASTFVAELLYQRNLNNQTDFILTHHDVFHAAKLASSATSHLVEEFGLNGFATRVQALKRMNEQDNKLEK
ncbi:hypothetical protein ABK040_003314 [Willaertia magna]